MQPQFELPRSNRHVLIFVASVVLTAILSPALIAGVERCFPDVAQPTTQSPADGGVTWDERSMYR
jgi:hypothetical protein